MPRSASRRLAAALGAALTLGLIGAGAVPAVAPIPPPPAGAELAALAQPPARSPLASQRIYFVMPDRYSNGDPANDRGGSAGPRTVTGYDPADTGWFHGGDFKGLTGDCTGTRTGLARVRELGFTALWVTPPYRQRAVQGGSAAYHGYWILDFTRVDPHLGTDADFAAFVACAHALGLKVYLDVVVNHTADVITPTGSGYVGPDELPYRDCRGRKFDAARYAGGKTFPCLAAKFMPRVPVVLAAHRNAKRPAWLNDVTRYHNRGDIDFSSCSETCFEQGDFYGLDDLFTEQPAVVSGLATAYGDWIRRYKVDGFRVDTARHVDKAFFRAWTSKILAAARAAGVPDFEIFGEAWIPSSIDLASFVRERGVSNVLDFPFQDAVAGFAGGDASARAIVSLLADDDYYAGAPGVAFTPPTFLGNHDMGRAAQKIQERSHASGDVLLDRVLLGHSLLYLLRGAPVVMYGDEVGMLGTGGDKEARQDMFPTQVAGWRTQPRVGSPPIGAGSSFDVAGHPIAEHLKKLAALRDAHPALATGATAVRYAKGDVLAVSRIDATAQREYVAVFNTGTATARVSVATATPSTAWSSLLGTAGASSGADGQLAIAVPGLSALLLRSDSDLPARAPAVSDVRVAPDDLTELLRVSATVKGGPVSVTFAVRRAGASRWSRLAADDSPPYRAFLDPKRYRRGETVYLAAVVRSSDGRVAVSPVVPFTFGKA